MTATGGEMGAGAGTGMTYLNVVVMRDERSRAACCPTWRACQRLPPRRSSGAVAGALDSA